MYTLETLIPDCVGRYITNASGTVQLASLINGRTYAKCWQALVYWLVNQYELGNSSNLAPIGVVVRTTHQLEQDGPIPSTRAASFRFFRTFLDKHGLTVKRGEPLREDDVSTIKMNLATLARLAGVEPQTYRMAMTHLFRRLGEVLAAKEQVLIDFSIGSLIGDKGVVDFLFHDTNEETKTPAPVDPLLLKRGGHWKAPRDTATITPKEKETRALRNKYPLQTTLTPRPPGDDDMNMTVNISSPQQTTLASLSSPLSPSHTSSLQLGKLIDRLPQQPMGPKKTDTLPRSTGAFRRKLKGNAPLRSVRDALSKRDILSPSPSPTSHTARPSTSTHTSRPSSAKQSSIPVSHRDQQTLNAVTDRVLTRLSSEDDTITGHKRKLSQHQEVNAPPVLDGFARTQAATYTDERYYQSASAKIASFYTPEAAAWSIDIPTGKLEYSGFMPFVPDRMEVSEHDRKMKRRMLESRTPGEIQLEERALSKSLVRYEYYLDHGIDDTLIAPMKEEWIRNGLALLNTNISSISESRVEQLIGNMLIEMKLDYHQSIKRAILDYVLRSSGERQRLSIALPPPSGIRDWGAGELITPPPPEWRQPIQRAYRALSKNLFRNNPAMLSLLDIWQKYKHHLLCDLPTSTQLPITIKQFEMMQKSHLERVRSIFVNEWGEEVEAVFQKYAKEENLTDENSVRFFEAVATVMSNQLRTIIQNSADAYHAFFMAYRNSPIICFADPEHKSLCTIRQPVWIRTPTSTNPELDYSTRNNPRPVFLQKLVVHKNKDGSQKIEYELSLPEMEKAVARIFDAMVSGLGDISRVENKIFSILDETKYLCVNIDDLAGESIWSLKRELTSVFNRSISQCAMLSSLYDEFAYLLDEDKTVSSYLKSPHTLDEYATQIIRYRNVSEQLTNQTHSHVRCPMVMCDLSSVNEILIQRSSELAEQILLFIAGRTIDRNVAICDKFKNVSTTLLKKPVNTRELVDLVKYLTKFKREDRADLLRDCQVVKEQLKFLFDNNYLVGTDVLSHVGASWAWLLRIDSIVKESESLVYHERTKMESHCEERRDNFIKLLERFALQVKQFDHFGDIKKISEYLSKIHTLKENITKAEEEIEALHVQENLLGLTQTDFYVLQTTKAQLAPFEQLWNLVSNFYKQHQAWMRGPVFKLDATAVEAEVDEMWKTAFRLASQLAETAPEPAHVAEQVKKDLALFKPNVPLLHILCNRGMRDRHWSKISDIVGFDLRPDQHTSLTRVLDMSIDSHVEQLTEISEAASKEYSIERAVETMKSEWTDIILQVKKWRDTGTHILLGDSVEEVQTLLDDHIVKTQTMRNSPFAKPFIEDIRDWEAWLNNTQEMIEVWLKVQSAWIYLESVMSGEDITKQMPAEGTMFKVVDSNWHKLMSEVVADPKVVNVSNIPHVLGILKEAQSLLDTIETGLNQYLETKRLFFPRFFFLSNDELLEILSETKDPLRVQPHLKKCFDGVNQLEFRENLDIVAMQSREGEIVPMVRLINPVDAKGAVERWLKEFEQVMRETVMDCATKAIKAYTQVPRNDWVMEHPGQIVLAVNHIHWTQNVARAITKNALKDLLDKSNAELQFIVMKVRGELPNLARCTLGALIVTDVHARDVVEHLIANRVTDTSSFEWQSQLRYYYEDNCIRVRMINSTIEYGCEYIGNSPRLVITALTDRCYRTLMGALQLKLGGAPEGPAGTGKTETVKDLSKAVGIQCVVFNCSDGLDFLAMGKFFKGLASSGAWSCFDEFNRIDLEVLSVVAQQIQTIQRAKEMHAKESTPTFMFEGTEIQLRPRCAVFITMNPGYAGRSELPDNLKSQFRPVSMMVPNYGLIAQILLYSYGFVEAQSLSRKIVSCFRLCSEQLSSQDHYDYGMRAVKTVLSAAQHLKQTYPREKESVLILRSIIDVNLPKFLAHDVPLFEGIISDLFPMTKVPSPDYGALTVAIRETITKMNLQPEPTFISKILQLYETIAVRHGLMLVGLPYAGKTMCYRVLAAALGELAKSGRSTERAVKVTVINPKAITISELYGSFSSLDHDWTDGILAHKFREAAIDAGPDRKWLLFDGPVDAVWIENMNSVLDDNKKLCLMSGQIIHMSDAMNIIFEVRDLAVASPATVSRCGMVYMEPDALGWRPIMTSWLTTLPEGIDEKAGKRIETLFDWLVPPCIRLIRTECTQYVHQSDTNLARALMDIFHSLIATDFADVKSVDEMGSMRAITLLESSFLFALIWSVGAGVDTEGRKRFDRFLREVCKEVNHYKLTSTFPKKGLVYEYMFHKEAGRWMAWTETLGGSYRIPEGATFQEILVPTLDTARYQFLLDLFVNNRKPLLFVGPTGVGKSVYINDTVTHLSRERYDSLTIHFSAQTSASATQGLIDDKLDRRRRGVFGPAGGKKCVIFVDDLNLPALDPFGASPPIELLRQYMDHSGWYDVKEKSFRTLVDIQFIAAMGPTGGGRNPVTDRFLRHLATVALVPFDDATMTLIYSTIMKWHFDQYKFAPTITALAEKLVSATKDLYQTVSAKLLPTPAKTHYVYNIRDMSRVFQGLLLSQPDQFDDAASFIRLWLHEVHRVFGDRLVTDADSEMFLEWCRTTVKTRFGVTVEKMLSHLDENKSNDVVTVQQIRSLFFGDYMTRKANRAYSEISDLSKLHATWANYLEEYNALSQKPMRLVMFRFAIEHASRLVRILKQPGGHALLLGVGGSGKQSLTRLAASVMEYDVISIELNRTYGIESWQSDLRKLLKLAGGEGKPCVFLFSDNQIRQESFLEDINGLLNASTVPNLWPAEEMAEVIELVRADAKRFKKAPDGTPSQFFSYFTERVRTNLHIVICMSPVGDKFRERLRMFPSLVACCTIDSYSAWPKDGLYSVARDFLSEVELDESTRAACVDMCMFTHAAVEKVATQFWDEQRRHVYVTPTSYLELITTFKSLLATKRKETMKIRGRYQTGLDKLAQTEKSVKTMQIELEEMQPALIRTSDETAEMMQVVQSETVEAQKIRDGVAKEENIATEAANTAKAIERECAEDLAEAMPILEAAIAALDTLTNQEISEIKAMRNPPKGVKLVMEALCVMKKIGPARIPDPSGNGKMIIDYWEPSKKFVLSDPKLLRSLVTYDKDNIDPRIIKKIRTYMANPEFDIAKIKTVSRAAHSLCSWIYAIEQYDRVIKQVKPKKEALAAAKAQYELVKQGLDVARQELSKVETKISTLRAHLDTMQDSKVELESKIATCSTKLERAHKLLSRLGGEKSRWTQIAADLGTRYANLTGDILLSSAVIAYLGAFTAPYRQRAIAALTAQCVIANVPCSPNFQLATVLGDPVHTRRWVIDGLPNDTFSIDNAIIVNKSRRFSFMIDPQGQASKWIKNMERENKLAVIKANDDYARTLENAIQYGVPVLMENIGEELDPTLEPLLLKQIFKKGSLRVIRFGDTEIEYADNFKFYMTTKVPNASYTPEMQVKVTILNFMITPEGLEDQLLGIVVAKEKPDLSDERARLVVTSASNATRLKEIEDKILHVLSQSKGNILDDDGSIEVLSASKAISNEIQEKQKIADKTEAEIDETRAGYKPVAFHASVLFFCIADLANIDPMYQYSLAWFISLFKKAIEASEFSHHLETRIHSLNDTFSLSLYKNIGRSLFQKDKLLFSFLLASRIAKASHGIDDEEWRFFLTGGVGLDSTLATNPLSEWMSDRTWAELTRLSQFPRFRGFAQDVLENASAWRTVCDSPEPHTMSFPGRWSNDLDAFQRLVVLRVLRPDKVVPAGRTFVVQQLGEPFMESLPFDLPSSFQDSAPHIPIIMMLSPGSDPMPAILKFASDTEMGDKVHSISLGQGQGAIAAKMIEKGLKEGTWLVLQNLHYCLSWMPILESICDAIDSKTAHPDFRLWLTSYPTPHFPVSILQNGVKLTTESPKGMRANLLDSYSRDPIVDERFFTTSRHQKILRTLVFALAWFHAAIQERRHFSSIGFNTGYGFNDTDFTISVRQLHMFLDEMNGDENDAHNIPFKALNYLTGECNYGGRVTDDWDRRTLMSMLASYLNPDVLQPGYALSSSRNYRIPIIPTTIISSSDSTEQQVSIAHDNNGSTQLYLDYIRSLPADIPCEVFGLHENAQITRDQKETHDLLQSILYTETRTTSGREHVMHATVEDLATDILKKLPPRFDILVIQAKYPTQYNQSMNTVLTQECIRFNKLTDVIRISLLDLQKALTGQVVMSKELERVANDMFDGKVPHLWTAVSYPSLKPLGGYINDLLERLKFLQEWIEHDVPSVVWISGLFFTQSFLTGLLQNYARRHRVAIDEVGFDFEFLHVETAGTRMSRDTRITAPSEGAYIRGLYLQGAGWDAEHKRLMESPPKVLFSPAPIIWLKPCKLDEMTDYPHYECPVYRTTLRRGTLSTTGHSTNFVMSVRLPTNEAPSHWVRRGVALISQLDD